MRAASRAGWIGVGMAVGSGLAMLFTPRSGPEVRERLGEQAKRARDYVAPHEDEAQDLRGRSPASCAPAEQQRSATRRPSPSVDARVPGATCVSPRVKMITTGPSSDQVFLLNEPGIDLTLFLAL